MRTIFAMLVVVCLLLPLVKAVKAADAVETPMRIADAVQTLDVTQTSLTAATARPVRPPAFTVIMQAAPSQEPRALDNRSIYHSLSWTVLLRSQASAQAFAPGQASTGLTATATGVANPATPQAQNATSSDAALATYNGSTPLPVQGNAMYYNPGIMQEVLGYRLKMGEVQTCDECVGYVALLRKGDLNRKVWIQLSDAKVEGPFLVIDVAARHHVALLLARNWVVDVDYATAQRWGMNRPIPVTILERPPQVASTSPQLEAVSTESPFGK